MALSELPALERNALASGRITNESRHIGAASGGRKCRRFLMGSIGPRVIVALDFPDPEQVRQLASRLSPDLCRVKVGKELFVRGGPALIRRLVKLDYDVFLDLKFHDIPNTAAAACRAAAELGVWMVNVHVSGGRRMLDASVAALANVCQPPLLTGVTVLTSLVTEDLAELGLPGEPEDRVSAWAELAAQCGLDGVVCSAHEAARLRSERGAAFALVTPGIRLKQSGSDDQRRVMTPARAIACGADYLVVGRPITKSDDPMRELLAIRSEISDD